MTIRTFGDLRRHLAEFDLETLGRQLSSWLDRSIASCPEDLIALNLEWDLVGGDFSDEVVADLLGYQEPGLDPASPGDCDWSSDEQHQYRFQGVGPIWSNALEELSNDETNQVDELMSSTIDTLIQKAALQSEAVSARREQGLRFFWSRHSEEPAELLPVEA